MTKQPMVTHDVYSVPRRFRATENLHVVLWLLKDMCWALDFRAAGVFMFGLTLTAAIVITWQTRRIYSDLMHNAAMLSWITANGYWMLTEFFLPQYPDLRYYTAIPFAVGLGFVGYYYGQKALNHYRARLSRLEPQSEMEPSALTQA